MVKLEMMVAGTPDARIDKVEVIFGPSTGTVKYYGTLKELRIEPSLLYGPGSPPVRIYEAELEFPGIIQGRELEVASMADLILVYAPWNNTPAAFPLEAKLIDGDKTVELEKVRFIDTRDEEQYYVVNRNSNHALAQGFDTLEEAVGYIRDKVADPESIRIEEWISCDIVDEFTFEDAEALTEKEM